MPWIDLDEAKAHLNKKNATDDDELEGFLFAACAAIEEVKGHVDPVTVATTHRTRFAADNARSRWPSGYGWRQWRYWIELTETPVLSVQSVAVVTTIGVTAPVVADDPVGAVRGWLLEDSMLYLPTPGEYVVTYTAGRDPVPGNYRLAALELVAHLWRGSQLNQSGGRPQMGGDQMMVVPHVASAMPYRVRELLGIYGTVVNDHVVIA